MAEAPLQNLSPDEEDARQEQFLAQQQAATRSRATQQKKHEAEEKAARRRTLAFLRLGCGGASLFIGFFAILAGIILATVFIPGVGTDSASASTCDATNPCGVNGDIVATAEQFAWTDRGHGWFMKDAKPAYIPPVKKYEGFTDDSASYPFSDCGVFVATVMKASGSDPNYFPRVVSSQWPYVKSHPNLYKIIGDEKHHITNTSQLQPGDILFAYDLSHTMFYIGKQPAPFDGGDGLSASVELGNHDGHVPEISGWYTEMQYAARYIGGKH